MIIIVMGVTGVGKNTVGSELASRLQYEFKDADDFHSPRNIENMSQGIPLTDEDRLPWLQTLHRLLLDYSLRNKSVVLACSALKQSYRDILSDNLSVTWVYLRGSETEILERLSHRHGHFAHDNLLQSQLEILEEPKDAIVIDVGSAPTQEVERILAHLSPPR
jgi:gluconokinase